MAKNNLSAIAVKTAKDLDANTMIAKSCSFSVNTLESESINVRRAERKLVDMVYYLSRIYSQKCPATVKDWEHLVMPKFLTLVARGIVRAKIREKRCSEQNVKNNKQTG